MSGKKKMIDLFEFKEKELYGSALPESEEDLEHLKKIGIKVIVSLDESIVKLKQVTNIAAEFEHHEIFITDYEIPHNEQVEKFLKIVEQARKEKKPVLVHCYAGCGRTGVMLALAEKFLFGEKEGLKAIENLRKVRPCAVETLKQVMFVQNYSR